MIQSVVIRTCGGRQCDGRECGDTECDERKCGDTECDDVIECVVVESVVIYRVWW